MTSSGITLVENGTSIGLDGALVASSGARDWHGFPIEIRTLSSGSFVEHRYNPNPILFFNATPLGHAEIVSGARSYRFDIHPGSMSVFQAGFEINRSSWACSAGEVIALDLAAHTMDRLLPDQPRLPQLRTELLTIDPVLAHLVEAMRLEIDSGCLSGRLYSEGLSIAMLGYLGTRFSTPTESSALTKASRTSQRLTPGSIARIRDYVQEHLSADLSIAELGKILNLSAFHFARMFKASVGVSPHRFILEQRVERAAMLLNADLSLVEIALMVGFSSQAHFTQVFRKLTGTTPARSRAN
jgi:AraC family transcriptional regulator